ncbi:MAG: sigma-70 family RNA polymerase sigma factor [Planctomycetota bacterium]
MYGEPNNSTSVQTIERLLVAHRNEIRNFIGRRSGSVVLQRTTIDDLYQDTATAALASAETFEYVGEADFICWVSTIARRVISHSLRGPQGRASTFRIRGAESSGIGVSETRLYAPNRTPSSAVANSERSGLLVKVLRELPSDYRTVLQLSRIEEHPLAEVAARMNRTKSATCMLIARAMAMLREKLRED